MSALLRHHTLISDRLLTFLVAFSTLVYKLSFFQSLHSHPSLPRIMTTRCLTVTGGGSVGECNILCQLSWLLGEL